MADESNVHVKVAMADVLGLLVISMFTTAVGIFGLGTGASAIGLVVAIGPFVGIATLVAAIFAYLNENLLATAIFGPLAVFFFTIVGVGGLDAAVLCMIIGIIILADALVSIFQPVKMLPILLFIAAIAFFVTALWYNANISAVDDSLRAAVGGLWILYSIISWYMAAAIIMLVLKGKQVLPLLIKA